MTGAQKRRMRAGILSAIAAAAAGAGIYSYGLGLTVEAWLRSTGAFGIPIALIITGLAAPSVAKVVVGNRPLTWGNSALIGVLTAIGPLGIILLAVVALRLGFGREVDFDNWDAGFLALLGAGVAGGLVFRALHGPGTIGETPK